MTNGHNRPPFRQRRFLILGIALFASASASTAKPSDTECLRVLEKASQVTSETTRLMPLLYIASRSEFEKKADYEKRVVKDIEAHEAKAASHFTNVSAFRFGKPIAANYNADHERLTLSAPPIGSASTEVGRKKYKFVVLDIPDGESVRKEEQYGSGGSSISLKTDSRRYHGVAFVSKSKHPLLMKTGTLSLQMPADRARGMKDNLELLVVGKPTKPWGFSEYASSDPELGYKSIQRTSYYSNYVVIDLSCAAISNRKTKEIVLVIN